MTKYERLTTIHDFLLQYALDAKRQSRHTLTGGHITRRKGQSLEFHDYTAYTPGDDMRHLDLRTSVRVHGMSALQRPDQWLIREFAAEEHLKLFISIDTHETMHYPQQSANISKLQVALWLADALSFIAFQTSDKVLWHPLFIPSTTTAPSGIYETKRYEEVATPFTALQQAIPGQLLTLNEAPIERSLKPAYVWVIISDFYFPKTLHQQFAHRVRAAQQGNRWVMLIDMDSWAYEKDLIGQELCRIWGANVAEAEQRKLRLTKQRLGEAQKRIADHKNTIFNGCGITNEHISTWAWENDSENLDYFASTENIAHFFRTRWQNDSLLQQLFRRPAL